MYVNEEKLRLGRKSPSCTFWHWLPVKHICLQAFDIINAAVSQVSRGFKVMWGELSNHLVISFGQEGNKDCRQSVRTIRKALLTQPGATVVEKQRTSCICVLFWNDKQTWCVIGFLRLPLEIKFQASLAEETPLSRRLGIFCWTTSLNSWLLWRVV